MRRGVATPWSPAVLHPAMCSLCSEQWRSGRRQIWRPGRARAWARKTGDLVPTPPQSALAPRTSAALAVRELTRTMSGTFSSSIAPPSASYRSRTPSLWGWHACVCVCICSASMSRCTAWQAECGAYPPPSPLPMVQRMIFQQCCLTRRAKTPSPCKTHPHPQARTCRRSGRPRCPRPGAAAPPPRPAQRPPRRCSSGPSPAGKGSRPPAW